MPVPEVQEAPVEQIQLAEWVRLEETEAPVVSHMPVVLPGKVRASLHQPHIRTRQEMLLLRRELRVTPASEVPEERQRLH
jgi:hypothetical protein